MVCLTDTKHVKEGGIQMSLSEIKENIDNFDKKDKEDLIRYIHELLIYEKRQESKIISLNTEIKFLNRHLKKVRDMIDKTLVTKLKDTQHWNKQNDWL